MAPTARCSRGRSTSGSMTRCNYLDAIEAKNKLTEERYRRAQEEQRRAQEELREERKKTTALVKKIDEMSAQMAALIKQIAELTANTKSKRKRSPAKKPSSDSEEDSPADASRLKVAKRPARPEQVSTSPNSHSPDVSFSEMEEDAPQKEEAEEATLAPKKKTLAEAPKDAPATIPSAKKTTAEALKSPTRTPAQTPAAPPSAAVKAAEKKKEKLMNSIPPVVIDGNDDWIEVRRKLKTKNICFRSAQLTARSTRIVPATVEDFRKLTKHLDEDKRGYHSFTLGQDKCFHIVIRKLAMNTDPKDIQQELQEAYGIAAEVNQMMDRRKKRPMPLFLVKTKDPKIHEVKTLFDLGVKLEEKKKSKEPTQCYRCQAIGHSQQHCHHEVRCVACGGNHRSTECTLEKPKDGERNAHCCNCDGDGHPANYRGCPKFPKRSYAAAARQGKPDATRGNSSEYKKTGPSQPSSQTKKTQPRNQASAQTNSTKTKTTATKQTLDKDQIMTQIQALFALLGEKQC